MFDFDRAFDRRGTSSKWDTPIYPAGENADLVPMWVADMDFATPDCIINAISKRLEHPIMGYFRPDDRFYSALIHWNQQRRGITDLEPRNLMYQNSTLGGAVAALKLFSNAGDSILVHTPNYAGFSSILADNERTLLPSPLVRDSEGIFRIDFADMEQKFAQNNVKCIIFCSPHNPTGRVWTADELKQVADLCEKYGVKIIADEIWADFIFEGHTFVPFAQVSDYARQNTLALYGTTKTFNLAALRTAYSVCYNPEMSKAFKKICDATHFNVPNILSVEAMIAACNEGADYVDALVGYVAENLASAHDFITQHIPHVVSTLPQGTYNMWLKFENTGRSDEENMQLMAKHGLVCDPPQKYNITGYFRLNAACPRAQLVKALEIMKSVL